LTDVKDTKTKTSLTGVKGGEKGTVLSAGKGELCKAWEKGNCVKRGKKENRVKGGKKRNM